MFKKKDKEPLIKFVSVVEGLELIDEATPKPSKHFIPEWFKSLPSFGEGGFGTVRLCPSFPDFFSLGYVMPMWSDSVLMYNKEANFHSSEISKSVDPWSIHPGEQLLDYYTPNISGHEAKFVFKANCPWRIITPPGYSVLQLPMFYQFNPNWTVLPGVIDTDIHHEVNQQLMFHGGDEPVRILRGEPLAMYIPFERKKYKNVIEEYSGHTKRTIDANRLSFTTKFHTSGEYRRQQRLRDKKAEE